MIRTVLVTAGLVIAVTAVVAQGDPIAERKGLMKGNGAAAKTGTQMAKGDIPFDLAKAKEIFRTYERAADRMPALFPESSKTGGETTAAPKIWEDMARFKAAFAKFGTDARDADAATKDLDSFKASFGIVTKNCGSCHESYRIRKS